MGTETNTLPIRRRRRSWELGEAHHDSMQRAWPAISKTRMVFGLAAAPLIPCTVFWLWIWLTRSEDLHLGDFILTGGVSTGLGMCWFIGAGSLFLVWLGRTYGTVGRFNCLALGATLTFAMPILSASYDLAVTPEPDVGGSLGYLLAAASGLILAPIGILGGWVLWRLAIRPAARPLSEMADVF